jgi:lysozyme
MVRELNKESIEHIKRWEGLRLEAYPDPGSSNGEPWTIGYGHTSDAFFKVERGLKITPAKAEELLIHDLSETCKVVDESVKVELTDNQYGALVSFVYNIGPTAFNKSTLLKKLNKGEYSAVPSELARWTFNDGAEMEGLVNRRAAEAGLWAKGSFVASNTVAVEPTKPAMIDKETISWATTILSSLGLSFNNSGPIQWVLAGILVVSFIVGLSFFIYTRMVKK